MKDRTSPNDTLQWLDSTYRTILSRADTGGAMTIVESVTRPGGGPPRHVHHKEDEIFVVLSGEVVCWVEGAFTQLGPGQSAFIPRGKEHSFQIIGDQPARKLIILTPGGFEDFFEEMAKNQYAIPEDMAEIVASGERHNLTFTGPPIETAEIY